MDGFVDAIGDGITGLVSGAFSAIGGALRGIVQAGNQALPGGMFYLVLLIVVIVVGWNLAKR